ncbi:ornithine cyclodeaminase family protein [Ramlibacter sp.]|uniref:ornithine cyclodeaminase family protein n=1 Tax=Ramlibacter sp. TaxID=1917967 RepID=UPI002C735FF4|nr:ornithine cyclodeaminase family protein [Ramlibacter sp.]HWI84152.1 ornithine cyclodeaminase family protein [Ramlibacter sp.]
MIVISEAQARQLVRIEDAIDAVEHAFVAMSRQEARNYPVVREPVGYRDAVFGVKTGCDRALPLLGLKAGGYWPHNAGAGASNHQSAMLLFDPETGRASALVSANYLTGVRTGAASAIATRHLARRDASVLGIIGAGVQAHYQLRATLAVRPIRSVHAWNRSPANLELLARTARELGLEFVAAGSCRAVAEAADVLVTVTPSQQPLVAAEWVRPGTHINAMGADTRGKQELDPRLVAAAVLFVDEAAQAMSIGECQHAFAAGLVTPASCRATLGEVAAGLAAGRQADGEITLFDGTGVALQDLVVADLAVRAAATLGLGATVDY